MASVRKRAEGLFARGTQTRRNVGAELFGRLGERTRTAKVAGMGQEVAVGVVVVAGIVGTDLPAAARRSDRPVNVSRRLPTGAACGSGLRGPALSCTGPIASAGAPIV
jgi:hypothetical protein